MREHTDCAINRADIAHHNVAGLGGAHFAVPDFLSKASFPAFRASLVEWEQTPYGDRDHSDLALTIRDQFPPTP